MRTFTQTLKFAILSILISMPVYAQTNFQELNTLEGSDELYGASVGLGDFDDNGLQDLSVNLPRFTFNNTIVRTQTYLYYSSLAKPADTFFSAFTSDDGSENDDSFDSFGEKILSGDFNGDGFDDMVISAPDTSISGGLDSFGCVHIFYGDGTQPLFVGRKTLCGSTTNQYFGQNIAVGDLNSDGKDDLAVYSANQVEVEEIIRTRGMVSVFYGDKNGLPDFPEMNLDAPSGSFQFGHALLIAEFQGMDLLVGAPRDESNGTNSGRVFIYSGQHDLKQFSSVPEYSVIGSEFECLGTSLAVGELFGSQGIDLVVGAGNRHNGDGCGMTDTDQVQVFTGIGNAVSSSATYVFDGYEPVVGQFHTSGYQDLVFIDDSNVNVHFGTSIGLPVSPDVKLEQSSLRNVTLGDLTGDGLDDMAVSYTDEGLGRVGIFGIDECPEDPDKLSAGACGCGLPETDDNGNGISDCNSTGEVRFYLTSAQTNVRKLKKRPNKKVKRRIVTARKELVKLSSRGDIELIVGAGLDIQKELKAVAKLIKKSLNVRSPKYRASKRKALKGLKRVLAFLA